MCESLSKTCIHYSPLSLLSKTHIFPLPLQAPTQTILHRVTTMIFWKIQFMSLFLLKPFVFPVLIWLKLNSTYGLGSHARSYISWQRSSDSPMPAAFGGHTVSSPASFGFHELPFHVGTFVLPVTSLWKALLLAAEITKYASPLVCQFKYHILRGPLPFVTLSCLQNAINIFICNRKTISLIYVFTYL